MTYAEDKKIWFKDQYKALKAARRHPDALKLVTSKSGFIYNWAVNLYVSIRETGTPTPTKDFVAVLKNMVQEKKREEKAKLRSTSSAASSQPPETLP